MEKYAIKLAIFNGEDFGYWKNRTRNYLLSQGCAIWEIIQTRYMFPAMLENATQGELQRYENNYKALNLITYEGLSFTLLMRALLKLSLLVRILTIGSIKPFLRNPESP
jgi:hypothetical protein